jgi:hypothetical protein
MGEFFVVRRYDKHNQRFKEFVMKSKFDGFMIGLILIAAGGLFMARNLGYDIDLTPAFGMVVSSALSAVCFIRYFAGDLRRWGRLMPACLFAAFAGMIGLSEAGARDALIAVPLFIGFAIPFVVALIADHQKNYWAVIPAAIFSVLALTALLQDRASDALLVTLLAFVVATPFYFVYFTQPKQWWALIPAGILSSIGFTALLVAFFPALEYSNVKGTLAALGFAATFGALYLRRGTIPTEWAKYPTIVFGIVALVALLDKTGIDGGPLILIALGLLVLLSTVRPRRHTVS